MTAPNTTPVPLHVPRRCPGCKDEIPKESPFGDGVPGHRMLGSVCEVLIVDEKFDEGKGGGAVLVGWACGKYVFGTVVRWIDSKGNHTEVVSTDHVYATNFDGRDVCIDGTTRHDVEIIPYHVWNPRGARIRSAS